MTRQRRRDASRHGMIRALLTARSWHGRSTVSTIWLLGKRSRSRENIPGLSCGLLTVGDSSSGESAYFHALPFAEVARSQHVASGCVIARLQESRCGMADAGNGRLGLWRAACCGAGPGHEFRMPWPATGVFFDLRKDTSSFRTPAGRCSLGTVATVLALTGTFEEPHVVRVRGVDLQKLTGVALLRLGRRAESHAVLPGGVIHSRR